MKNEYFWLFAPSQQYFTHLIDTQLINFLFY